MPTMITSLQAVPIAWRAVLLFASGTVWAATPPSCPHGALANRYCDRNGDLVADPPEQPTARAHPEELVLGLAPTNSPARERKLWQSFAVHLTEALGKPVRIETFSTSGDQLEAIRAGQVQIAAVLAANLPEAVEQAGLVPIITIAHQDGQIGSPFEILVRAQSQFRRIEHLRAKTIAFSTRGSLTGHIAARRTLSEQFLLEPGLHYTVRFTGSQSKSLRELVSRTVDAAVVSKEAWERAQAAREVEPEALRSIYRSAPLPFFAWGVPHDLAPELVSLVVEAFVTFPWQGSPLELEFREAEGTRFVPTQYAHDWAEVRRLLGRISSHP